MAFENEKKAKSISEQRVLAAKKKSMASGGSVSLDDLFSRIEAGEKEVNVILKADVKFIRSNMFEKIDGIYDLIISNPPYIDTDEIEELDDEVKNHDPYIALDGGALGLKYYNIIHDNLRKHLTENGMLILEIGDEQKELLLSLFNDFTLVESITDFEGHDRVLVFKR